MRHAVLGCEDDMFLRGTQHFHVVWAVRPLRHTRKTTWAEVSIARAYASGLSVLFTEAKDTVDVCHLSPAFNYLRNILAFVNQTVVPISFCSQIGFFP